MYHDLDDLEEIGSHYFFKFFSIDRRRTERERNNFDFRTGRGGEKLLRPVTGLRAVLLRSAKKSRKRYHTRIDSSLLVWHEVLRSMCAATCVIQRGILWSHLHTEFVPKVRRLGQPRHVFTSSNRAALIVFNTDFHLHLFPSLNDNNLENLEQGIIYIRMIEEDEYFREEDFNLSLRREKFTGWLLGFI